MLICKSSLLWGILHCIKSQQVLAKQRRKSLVLCGLDGRYFGNEKVYGLSKLCYWQGFYKHFLKVYNVLLCHAAHLPTLKHANMQTVFVFIIRS